MTPAARVAAAIGILDRVLDGASAEQVLTGWARQNRYAGSGDRAAIRDQVFGAIRCRRSFAAMGGAPTGRGLMIGALRASGQDPAAFFTGEGYAAPPLAAGEGDGPDLDDLSELVRLDCPDWLAPQLRSALGPEFAPVLQALRLRAPVFLRVNRARSAPARAIEILAADGIVAGPHDLSPSALTVTENPRKINRSRAYLEGLVELQDAASQAVVDVVGVTPGMRVLDFCAGGGGKALAMAAQGARVFAHDADPARMRDLPARAARAGAEIEILPTADLPGLAPFDLVLADAPCSGSGAWRRSPQGKWDLTPDRLDELCVIQAGILEQIAPLAGHGGRLAYATCSLLERENSTQIDAFLARQPGWICRLTRRFTPLDGGDGFFVALLTR